MVKAEVCQSPRCLSLEDNVGVHNELQKVPLSRRTLKIEQDASLRCVVVPPPETAIRVGFVVHEWTEVPAVVSPGRLGYDDVCTQSPQYLARPCTPEASYLEHA